MKFRNENVLTINQVASLFEQSSDAIKKNICRAKEKYLDGNDLDEDKNYLNSVFIQATHEEVINAIELGEEPISPPNSMVLPNDKTFPEIEYNGTKGLIFITEEGFALLANQSNSTIAWKIHFFLVKEYFHKTESQSYNKPMVLAKNKHVIRNPKALPDDTMITVSDIMERIVRKDLLRDTQSRRYILLEKFNSSLSYSKCVLFTLDTFGPYVLTEKGVHYGFSFSEDELKLNELQAPISTWGLVLRGEI